MASRSRTIIKVASFLTITLHFFTLHFFNTIVFQTIDIAQQIPSISYIGINVTNSSGKKALVKNDNTEQEYYDVQVKKKGRKKSTDVKTDKLKTKEEGRIDAVEDVVRATTRLKKGVETATLKKAEEKRIRSPKNDNAHLNIEGPDGNQHIAPNNVSITNYRSERMSIFPATQGSLEKINDEPTLLRPFVFFHIPKVCQVLYTRLVRVSGFHIHFCMFLPFFQIYFTIALEILVRWEHVEKYTAKRIRSTGKEEFHTL